MTHFVSQRRFFDGTLGSPLRTIVLFLLFKFMERVFSISTPLLRVVIPISFASYSDPSGFFPYPFFIIFESLKGPTSTGDSKWPITVDSDSCSRLLLTEGGQPVSFRHSISHRSSPKAIHPIGTGIAFICDWALIISLLYDRSSDSPTCATNTTPTMHPAFKSNRWTVQPKHSHNPCTFMWCKLGVPVQ